MASRAFQNADGEMLIVPQQGALAIITELGRIQVEPLQIAVILRGVRFKVELDGPAPHRVPVSRAKVAEVKARLGLVRRQA